MLEHALLGTGCPSATGTYGNPKTMDTMIHFFGAIAFGLCGKMAEYAFC